MPWDNEIWAPCRLGEKFEYTDLGNRRNGWLLSVSADWMGGRGNHCAVNRQEDLLMPHGGYNIKIGLGPRPWSKCWTFEPKIMIVPPSWIWDFSGFDADKLGIDLHNRDGAPRKIRLQSVGISYGRAIYQMQIIGGGLLYLESIPLLDHYFAPVWPLAPMQRRIGYWLYEFNEGEKDHE